jgi:hypothetical protein
MEGKVPLFVHSPTDLGCKEHHVKLLSCFLSFFVVVSLRKTTVCTMKVSQMEVTTGSKWSFFQQRAEKVFLIKTKDLNQNHSLKCNIDVSQTSCSWGIL